MADGKDLFEQGEDVTEVFKGGSDLDQPTPEDTSEFKAEPHEYSAMQAFGIGAGGTPVGLGQGLSLGFGEEIGGLSGALGAKTGGDDRDFWEIYRNIRNVLREEQKTAEEQHPMAALSGELVGGLAVPLGVAGEAKTALTADKIRKARGIIKAGQAAQKEARVLKGLEKIGEMSKIGAKAGAIAGLGTSEADLTTGEPGQYLEAAKDMGRSAVIGAGVGGGIQTAGAGLKLTKEAIKSLPYVDDALKIRELTKKGFSLAGETKNISKEARDLAYNILDQLETLRTFTGSLVGKSKEEAEKIIGKVKIDGAIQNIREKIKALKPVTAQEKEEVANLQEALSNILDETEKVQHKYIPKPQLPKASQAEKAAQKVAKKTAEAEAKDQIKLGELYDQLASTTDPDEAEGIVAQINKIESGETQFPPEVAVEPKTDLEVLGVSRGAKKQPIVEAITPEPEPVFTPIQRVEVGREIVPGKSEVTPGELKSHLQSLQDIAPETAKGQRAVGMAREELKGAEKLAGEAAGTEGKQALEILGETSKGFGSIKDIQKSFGLPESGRGGDLNPSQEKTIVDNIQRAILGFTENKISSDRFAEIMDDLANQFPQAAKTIKGAANSISERYRLSKMMSSQSLEGVKRGGLAVPAMMGRAAEYGTATEQAVRKQAGKLVKGAANEVVDLGKKVYDASPETIQKMADVAMQKGTKFGQLTSKTLSRLVNAPMAKRRAVLYTLMQQPDFRDFAKEMLPLDTEE